MKPLLQHLENESLLLLYMAGELPADDRAELELMLARDGGLRSQLESLRSAQSVSYSVLLQLDEADQFRSMESAMRPVDRAMVQWQVDRLARPAAVVKGRSIMPVIGWSVGSAVAALLVFCIWWGFRTDNSRVVVTTQPLNAPFLNHDRYGDQGSLAQNAPMQNGPLQSGPLQNGSMPANPTLSPDNSAPPVQIVTVDSDRLGDLERQVSEDLQ